MRTPPVLSAVALASSSSARVVGTAAGTSSYFAAPTTYAGALVHSASLNPRGTRWCSDESSCGRCSNYYSLRWRYSPLLLLAARPITIGSNKSGRAVLGRYHRSAGSCSSSSRRRGARSCHSPLSPSLRPCLCLPIGLAGKQSSCLTVMCRRLPLSHDVMAAAAQGGMAGDVLGNSGTTRSFNTLTSTASTPLPATGARMRQSGGDRYNRVGPLMATSTSPPSISERDIMREFASAAADEARGHSSSSNAGRGDGGPAGVDGGGVSAKGGDDRGGTAAAAAVATEDRSRPTGYR